METQQKYPDLKHRIDTLEYQIGVLARRIAKDENAEKVADSGHLRVLEDRHRVLQARLTTLEEGGIGMLQRFREEIAIMEDDLRAMVDSLTH